jgi:hypothetical protein
MFLTLLAAAALSPQAVPTASEITIYNQGFALVKQNRTLHLEKGRQKVSIEDVAAQIEPESVGFRSIGPVKTLDIYEQNYQFDLISPLAILNKSVGAKVRLTQILPNSGQDVLTGTLLSSPTAMVNSGHGGEQTYNGMVIRADDGRIILNPTGEVEVTSIPEGLISRPTLVWDINSSAAQQVPIELSYLTQQISWNADYVLTLNPDSESGDLQGWVTLNNNSGATFKNTKLKLVAGDVHRVPRRIPGNIQYITYDPVDNSIVDDAKDQFKEEVLFEYHLYTLDRPTDLHDKETKQVSLLERHNLTVTKRLVFDPQKDSAGDSTGPFESGEIVVNPEIRIYTMNTEANHLGMPLPQGNVKVYQRDQTGSIQMLTETPITNTPKDEKLTVVAGEDLNLVGRRKRVAFSRVGRQFYSEKFEISIKNHGPVAGKIAWIERHHGDWKVTEKTMAFTKLDSNSMQFEATIPANGSKTIDYTVLTKF